jgi:predicted RNase H-like HicB family nuclease
VSDGRTREEAIQRVKEAIEVYIEALVEDGLPVPEEFEQVQVVALDLSA